MLRSLGPEPERARQEVGLEDRLNDDLCGRLDDAVTDSGNRQRPLLALPAGLRYEHPASWQCSVAAVPQIRGQLIEQTGNPVALDVGDGLFIDAGRAFVGAHQLPRALQHVPPIDLVVERVEPSSGLGLGRPVERSLQFSDLILLGGPSHLALTSPSLCVTHGRSSGPSLTAGSVVPSAHAVLRPPPTPSRHDIHFPAERRL